MMEKRLTVRLRQYWESLRGQNPLPVITRFNSAAMPDIWPYCLSLSLQPAAGNKVTYHYDYQGAKVVKLFSRDLTGHYASSQLHNLPGSGILKQIDAALEQCDVKEDEGQFVNARSKIVKYRTCLLPFGQEKVSHVIVGLSWREF